MKEPVKRPYRSDLRRDGAARTRVRIVESAGRLFEAQGYGPTTIRQIADEAGVAVDTVYAAFGSKVRVLTALIDQRLSPPDGGVNVTERPEATAVRDEPDQRRMIERFASDIAEISARVRPSYTLLRTAAAVEPKVHPVFEEMEAARRANMARVAGWVAARGPLRVEVERAGEIIAVLAGPLVAAQFCDEDGWTQEEYARWLADTLIRTLLDPDGSAQA